MTMYTRGYARMRLHRGPRRVTNLVTKKWKKKAKQLKATREMQPISALPTTTGPSASAGKLELQLSEQGSTGSGIGLTHAVYVGSVY